MAGSFSKPEISSIMCSLRSKDPKARKVALEELPLVAKKVDNFTLGGIIEYLKVSQDWVERRTCALFLGESGKKEAVEPLIDALEDCDRGVARTAARSLVKLAGVLHESDLLRLAINLWAESESVRELSASVLGRVGKTREPEKSVMDLLNDAMHDERADVRFAAVKAVYEMGGKVPENELVMMLGDGPLTRHLVVQMLKRNGSVKSRLFLRTFYYQENTEPERFRRYLDLLELLTVSRCNFVRFKAIKILSDLDSSRWGFAIRRTLADSDKEVRLFAASPATAILEHFIQLLTDSLQGFAAVKNTKKL